MENYPCENKEQLNARERFYIETIECVNKNIPTRTNNEYLEYQKQYKEKNKDSLLEKHRQYNNKNKDVINEKQKQYYEKNKDTILEYQKQYNEKNKDMISEYQNVSFAFFAKISFFFFSSFLQNIKSNIKKKIKI